MKAFKIFCLLLLLLSINLAGQTQDLVPTLIPPTPIPVTALTSNDALLSQSTVARIQQNGVLRVGILYNEPPFGEFDLRGEVSGFDADLARKFAELWAVELELIQVTRQNRFELLRNGEVDLLMAAVVHQRDLDQAFEFSQSYRVGQQTILTRATDELSSAFALAGRKVGYVVGTESETALLNWLNRVSIPVQTQPFLNLDLAYRALLSGQIDGVVGRDTHLRQLSINEPDSVKILEDGIQAESFAVVMLRQDLPMRNLVNRTLQYLLHDAELGRQTSLEQIYTTHFAGTPFAYDALMLYENIGSEAPSLAQAETSIPYPQNYVSAQILANRVLRVAGVPNPTGLPESQARLAQAYRALVEAMAGRWGARVEFIDGDAIALVEAGQADLAIGVIPDWSQASRVDFSQAYLVHGDRLLIPSNRDFERFGDLRGRIVATIIGDIGARERVTAWAESVRVTVRAFETTEDGISRTLLQDTNADVVYGDSLLLMPHLQQNPNNLKLGPSLYSREYLAFALPRNDPDFRALVNYTLQEMARENALTPLFAAVIPEGEKPIELDIWAGSATYLGLTLAQ